MSPLFLVKQHYDICILLNLRENIIWFNKANFKYWYEFNLYKSWAKFSSYQLNSKMHHSLCYKLWFLVCCSWKFILIWLLWLNNVCSAEYNLNINKSQIYKTVTNPPFWKKWKSEINQCLFLNKITMACKFFVPIISGSLR